MPLKTGKSKEVVRKNVSELMHAYKNKGKIGTSHPKSKKAAQKQAVAIALSKAKESFEEKVNRLLKEYSNLKNNS
jgi:hypothetical protein